MSTPRFQLALHRVRSVAQGHTHASDPQGHAGGGGAAGGRGGSGDPGIDPATDPDLAIALHMSLVEAHARREAAEEGDAAGAPPATATVAGDSEAHAGGGHAEASRPTATRESAVAHGGAAALEDTEDDAVMRHALLASVSVRTRNALSLPGPELCMRLRQLGTTTCPRHHGALLHTELMVSCLWTIAVCVSQDYAAASSPAAPQDDQAGATASRDNKDADLAAALALSAHDDEDTALYAALAQSVRPPSGHELDPRSDQVREEMSGAERERGRRWWQKCASVCC